MTQGFDLEQLVRERLAAGGIRNVSDQEFRTLSSRLQDNLEWKVGERLSEHLTDEQLDAFEALDGKAGLDFLNRWIPDHQAVVHQCLRELLDGLTAAVDAAAEKASATR